MGSYPNALDPARPDLRETGEIIARNAREVDAAERAYIQARYAVLATERQIIGVDHQAFGVGLTTKWKFPRHLRAAAGFHHNPEALSNELRNMAILIQIADVLCCQEQIGFYLSARDGTITDEMLEEWIAGLAVAEQLGGAVRPWQVDEPNGRIHVYPVAGPARGAVAA